MHCPQPERLTCFPKVHLFTPLPGHVVESEHLGPDLQGEASLPRRGLLSLGMWREALEDLNACHWDSQLLTASPPGFPAGSAAENLPAMQETRVPSLGSGRPPGGGNGNPLQCSCLGNPMDRGAWRATGRGDAKSGHG